MYVIRLLLIVNFPFLTDRRKTDFVAHRAAPSAMRAAAASHGTN